MTIRIIILLFFTCSLGGCASNSKVTSGSTGIITNKFDGPITVIEPVFHPDKYALPHESVNFPIFVYVWSLSPPPPTCVSLETPDGERSYLISRSKVPYWSRVSSEGFITPSYSGPVHPKYGLVISSEGLFFVNESGTKRLEVQPIESCDEHRLR
jgi:hypothetical protein